MLYLANPCGPAVITAMQDGRLGFIDTPAQGNKRPDGVVWCADNGAYSNNFDEQKWWKFLVSNADATDTCLFATAPDVVGDAAATMVRSLPWLSKIRELGYPAAFVAQNGLENLTVPWNEFDVLFVGGSLECAPCGYVWPNDVKPERRQRCPQCMVVMTEWKLGPEARALVAEAKSRGKWVHCGRVNSRRRYLAAFAMGCDSVDGTYLTKGPDVNLPTLLSWRHTEAWGALDFEVTA